MTTIKLEDRVSVNFNGISRIYKTVDSITFKALR